jgi:hypothetical protein
MRRIYRRRSEICLRPAVKMDRCQRHFHLEASVITRWETFKEPYMTFQLLSELNETRSTLRKIQNWQNIAVSIITLNLFHSDHAGVQHYMLA